MPKFLSLVGGVAIALGVAGAASAETLTVIKIGVLNDMSGPYADLSGKGSVVAAQLAAEDFAREAGPGAPKVEILSADHQNKADIGANITRAWVDRDGLAAVVDVPNSAVGLAVNQIMREKDRAFLASSTATSDLTGPQCAPTTVQWTFDTWGAGAWHRPGGHAGGRAELVLHRVGLRARRCPGQGCDGGHQGERRTGPWRRQGAARYGGSVKLPAAGAGVGGAGRGDREWRRRCREHDQAGGGVRPRRRQAEDGGAARVPDRCALDGPANGAGIAAHRGILLEPERQYPAHGANGSPPAMAGRCRP